MRKRHFREAAALQPDNWSRYKRSRSDFINGQGKYPQAIAAFKQALQITPDNAELYYNLGATYVDQGGAQSIGLAEQALKKSIALNPTIPRTRIWDCCIRRRSIRGGGSGDGKALEVKRARITWCGTT